MVPSGYLRTNIPGEVTNDYDVSSTGTDPIDTQLTVQKLETFSHMTLTV